MSKKQAEKVSPKHEDQVKLRTVLGLRPGIYLAVIYSFVLLLLFFVLLILPGIIRPGSIIVLKTEPAGAALRVDGVYMGTAPGRIFVPRGKHSLELILPGFNHERLEREIPGRIFASLLFPRRYPLEVELHSDDPIAAFAAAAADYAAWTFGGEPEAKWQIPLSLSEGAYRTGAYISANAGAAEEILKTSARFAVTRASLRDLVRAKTLADNGGLSPSPLSLARSADGLIRFFSENPAGAAWLAETIPPESAALITASAWYQKQLAGPPEALSPQSSGPEERLSAGGLSFTGIGGGTLARTGPFFPHTVPVAGFMISDTEVPAALFADFLDANPQWRADEREALIAKELVTDNYLRNDAGITERGIRSVSWYAAEAFCGWFNSQWSKDRLPPSMAGYEVRLPTEAEWEYAAKSVQQWAAAGIPAANLIKNLEGGAWEWCNDPYAPLVFIGASSAAVNAVASPERSIRGGSARNTGQSARETRASLPPAFCSPFVSFRVVIAKPVG